MPGTARVNSFGIKPGLTFIGIWCIAVPSCAPKRCSDLLERAHQEIKANVKMEIISEYIECDSTNYIGYYERGNLYYEYCVQLLDMKESGYVVDVNDVHTYMRKAMIDFNKSLQINQKHGLSYLGRAKTYLMSSKYDEACIDIKMASLYGASVDSLLLNKCK
jgi:hypothetical protein